jgi:hypothetical protein
LSLYLGVELIPASPAHIGSIANRMREWDVREAAAFGHSPKQALRLGLSASLWAITAKVDGRPEAMLGVCPTSLIEGRGQPWMLATDMAYGQARAFAEGWRPIVARMQADFLRLENWVAAGNERAITFLRHVGFTIDADVDDVRGLPMRRFGADSRVQCLVA